MARLWQIIMCHSIIQYWSKTSYHCHFRNAKWYKMRRLTWTSLCSVGPVGDVDGGAGGWAVSAACDRIHSDGVLSIRAQVLNSGCGLGAGDGEFLWGALACQPYSWHYIFAVRFDFCIGKTSEIKQKHLCQININLTSTEMTFPFCSLYSWENSCREFILSKHSLVITCLIYVFIFVAF